MNTGGKSGGYYRQHGNRSREKVTKVFVAWRGSRLHSTAPSTYRRSNGVEHNGNVEAFQWSV